MGKIAVNITIKSVLNFHQQEKQRLVDRNGKCVWMMVERCLLKEGKVYNNPLKTSNSKKLNL